MQFKWQTIPIDPLNKRYTRIKLVGISNPQVSVVIGYYFDSDNYTHAFTQITKYGCVSSRIWGGKHAETLNRLKTWAIKQVSPKPPETKRASFIYSDKVKQYSNDRLKTELNIYTNDFVESATTKARIRCLKAEIASRAT